MLSKEEEVMLYAFVIKGSTILFTFSVVRCNKGKNSIRN